MAYRNIFSGQGKKMWYSFDVFSVHDANRIPGSINDYLRLLFKSGIETTVILKSSLNVSDIFNQHFIPFVIFLCFPVVFGLK
jgi:hypothetical protein